MTKNAFQQLFVRALNRAAQVAELAFDRPIPRSFVIELHGAVHIGDQIEVDDAVDALYLETDRFYRIIDVAIVSVQVSKSVAFVRVSGHHPVGLSDTWDPGDLGPFKIMKADELRTSK